MSTNDKLSFERDKPKVVTLPKWTIALRSIAAYWQMLQFRIKLVWVSFGLFIILQAFSSLILSFSHGDGFGGPATFFALCVLGGIYVGTRLTDVEQTYIVSHRHFLSWLSPFAMRIQNSYTPLERTGIIPHQYYNIPREILPVAHEVHQSISFIMSDFIHSWYSEFISEDERFPSDVASLIEGVSAKIILRLSRVKLDKLLQTLFPELQKHLVIMEKSKHNLKKLKKGKPLQESRNLVACYETFSILHPAAMNSDLELDYLRSAFGIVMDSVLPGNVKACEPGVSLVREIVCQAVLMNAIDLISDPDFINHIVVLLALYARADVEEGQSDQSESLSQGNSTPDQSEDHPDDTESPLEQTNQSLSVPEQEDSPEQQIDQSAVASKSQCQLETSQSSIPKFEELNQDKPIQGDEIHLNLKDDHLLEVNHNNIPVEASLRSQARAKTEIGPAGEDISSSTCIKPVMCNHGSQGHHHSVEYDPPSLSCLTNVRKQIVDSTCGVVSSLDSERSSRTSDPPLLIPVSQECSRENTAIALDSHKSSNCVGTMVESNTSEVFGQLDGQLFLEASVDRTSAAEMEAPENPSEHSPILHDGSDASRSSTLESDSSDASKGSGKSKNTSTIQRHRSFPRSKKPLTFSGFSSFLPVPLTRRRSAAKLNALSKSVDSVVDVEATGEEFVGSTAERVRNKSVPDLLISSDDHRGIDGLVTKLQDQGSGRFDSPDGEDEKVPTVQGDVVPEDQRVICDLSITSTELVQQPNRKEYVLYVIEFKIKASEQEEEDVPSTVVELQVKRRYREFLTLHWKLQHQSQLKKSLKDVRYIPKRFAFPIMKNDMSGVEQRRRMLEKYLKQLLDIPKIHASDEIVDFLALNGNGHIAFVREAPSYSPNLDKILRNSLSGVKQGLKNLTPFPSSRSEVKSDKTSTDVQPLPENEDLDLVHLQILRVCSLMPGDSKFGLKDIMPYVIRDTLSRQEPSPVVPPGQGADENPQSHLVGAQDVADGSSSEGSDKGGLWLYSCIMDTLSILQKERGHWLFEENVQLLLKNVLGDLLQGFVQREIWTLLSPQSWALYLSLIKDVIWPEGILLESSGESLSQDQKDELRKKAEDILLNSHPNFLNVLFGKKQLQGGISQLFESVQNQHLNKHLIYTFFDHLLDQALPELEERTGDIRH